MSEETPKLTDKQEKFITEYLKCFNATEAARRAGYSEESCRQIGSENLSKPYIREEIDRAMSEDAMSAKEVLFRLTQQARSEHSTYWTTDFMGRRRPDLNAIVDNGMGHLIKEVEFTEEDENLKKIKFYDAQSALDKLARIHGLYGEDVRSAEAIQNERRAIFERLRRNLSDSDFKKAIEAIAQP